MQIHEITKGRKRTDEGILDDLKAAVTATKTGYQQGKAAGGGMLAGLKGAAQHLTSRDAYNQALAKNNQAKLANDPRITRGKTPEQIVNSLKNDPATKSAIQKLVPQFIQQFMSNNAGQVKEGALARRSQQRNAPVAPAQPDPQVMRPNPARQAAQQSAQQTQKPAAQTAHDLAHGTQGMPMGKYVSPSGTEYIFRLNNGKFEMQDPDDGTWDSVTDQGEIKIARQAIKSAQAQAQQQRQGNTQSTTKANLAGQNKEMTPVNPVTPNSSITIDQWASNKIKGFQNIKNDPATRKLVNEPYAALTQAVSKGDTKAVAKLLPDYLIAAKAATMYNNQQNIDKKQQAQRAKAAPVGSFNV